MYRDIPGAASMGGIGGGDGGGGHKPDGRISMTRDLVSAALLLESACAHIKAATATATTR